MYGDPCHWSTTIPDAPATTPNEIAADFAAQVASDATAPVEVTVSGYAGATITIHVPMRTSLPGAPREEVFGDCDQDVYGYYEPLWTQSPRATPRVRGRSTSCGSWTWTDRS